MKAEIVYVFDGYCGWCWGISSVVRRLATDFADRFQFSAVCGGLITGDRIGPLGDFGAYIEKAMPRVEELTGAVFSPEHRALIRNRQTMQDSRIPAAAFVSVIRRNPTVNTIELAHEILSLNFTAGRDLSRPESYADFLKKYQVDASLFAQDLSEEKLFADAEKQFGFAREIGAESFPTIVYGREGQYFPLCQGYQNYDNLAHALDVLFREPPEL